jgi:hypothetical protein
MAQKIGDHGYKARKTQPWKARHRFHNVVVFTCPECRPSAPWAVKPHDDNEEVNTDGGS